MFPWKIFVVYKLFTFLIAKIYPNFGTKIEILTIWWEHQGKSASDLSLWWGVLPCFWRLWFLFERPCLRLVHLFGHFVRSWRFLGKFCRFLPYIRVYARTHARGRTWCNSCVPQRCPGGRIKTSAFGLLYCMLIY